MPFPLKLVFFVIAAVCFLIASFMDWPRTTPPAPNIGHSFGWAGGFFLTLALASS